MKRVVHKWPLELMGTEINLPRNSKPLCVQSQGDKPCVWIERDERTDEEMAYRFITVGTGHEVPPFVTYLGTIQIDWFVGHVYWQEVNV